MTKIVVLDGKTLNPGDNPWDALETLGDLTVFANSNGQEVLDRASDADVVVVNKVRLTSDTLEGLPALRMIAVTATGYDCVDIDAAGAKGIVVSNVPIYGTDSVAQHVFALLLHVLHRVDLHDSAVRKGEWGEIGDFSFWKQPLTELSGKTMGVVGFGRIGRQVARLAAAFGMSIVAHSRSEPTSDGLEIESVSLPDLVARADVISLNCPLTAETEQMVDESFLAKVKPQCVLINTGRGALIDESALASALHSGKLLAAALDVCSTEPIEADNPLLSAPRCFITPHLAWATLEARQRLMATTVDNVRAFLSGQPIHRVV